MNRRFSKAVRHNGRRSGQSVVITVVVAVLFLILFGRVIANFVVDRWWYGALGFGSVFWQQYWAKVQMFSIAFFGFVSVAWFNLYLADRSAPTVFPANVHPIVERFHEVFGRRLRPLRYGVAAALGLLLAAPVATEWQTWLLFRNRRSFGTTDAQFGRDVGFYVFQLPLISFIVDWWFIAILFVLVLVTATHLLNGGVLFISTIPSMRRATKIHIAGLLAILATLKSCDYWITRWELTSSRRGVVDGATYTVVHAQIPALVLLSMIALLTAVLYLMVMRTDRWRPAVIASALWLVVALLGGVIYPGMVESLVVRPNQSQREAPYIARNVDATLAAFGLQNVNTRDVEFDSLTTAQVDGDIEAFQQVRLLNDSLMLQQFQIDRGEKAGLKIADLDVDRYDTGESDTQLLIAARELDLGGVPNTSWPSLHLVNTRGCDVVTAPLGKVTDTDRPVYTAVPLERPQLYFSGAISGFAIVNTEAIENPCGEPGPYQGELGVKLNGFGRRLAFATAFMDYNLIASGSIGPQAQVLWHRSIADRVSRLAPFLQFDNDPYPVVMGGEVAWVLDAYTSSTRYPYAQSVSSVELRGSSISPFANYVRNSVKAVVDAYTGEVTLYVMDELDPIISAWRGAFPDLFTDLSEMPESLREHLRYPEDLFTIQTDLYAKYHLAPEAFFEGAGRWSVAQAPSVDRQSTATRPIDPTSQLDASRSDSFASESDVDRFVPYYTLFRNGAEGDGSVDVGENFVILRPYVPFSTDDSRTELQAYMTASSDPGTYGQLTSYVVTNDPKPNGPMRAADLAETDSVISETFTNQATVETSTRIKYGDMQIIPVAQGFVYARPVFLVTSDSTKMTYVIVVHDGASVMAKSLSGALAKMFPGFESEIGDRVATNGGGSTETVAPDSSVPTEPATDPTVDELLAQAAAAYSDAQQLLADGDLGGYQAKMDEVGRLVIEADRLTNGGDAAAAPAGTAPTPSTTDPANATG